MEVMNPLGRTNSLDQTFPQTDFELNVIFPEVKHLRNLVVPEDPTLFMENSLGIENSVFFFLTVGVEVDLLLPALTSDFVIDVLAEL
jgi:hypothetical protein